jgi:hypothetical protein
MAPSLPASLAALPLQKVTLKATLRQKVTPPPILAGFVEMTAQELSAVCLDEARIACGLTPKELAAHFELSESVIHRWLNPHARECPSQQQLTSLGSEFMRQLGLSYGRRFGWRAKALLDVVKAIGELAEEMSA